MAANLDAASPACSQKNANLVRTYFHMMHGTIAAQLSWCMLTQLTYDDALQVQFLCSRQIVERQSQAVLCTLPLRDR